MQTILFGRRVLRHLSCTKVTRLPDLKGKQKCINGESQIVPIFEKALLFGNDNCIKDSFGQYTYFQLYYNSKRLSGQISNICGIGPSSTVAFVCSNDILTTIILWASWMSGQKVLALNRVTSVHELSNLVQITKAKLVISSDLNEKFSKQLAADNSIPLIHIDHRFIDIFKTCSDSKKKMAGVFLNEFYNNYPAMVIYAKVNNSKPILKTHKELDLHIKKAVQLWNVSKSDKILYMCPSFHSYNDEYIFNLMLPLSVGGQINILEPFNSKVAWSTILGLNIPSKERTNVLIAEPKIYQQLILEYEHMFAKDKRMAEYIRDYCLHNIRSMMTCFYRTDTLISSSWFKITGHYLLDSNYLIEYFNSEDDTAKNKGAFEWLPKRFNAGVRIVNAKSQVLLELNETETKRFLNTTTAIVGRVMVSDQDEMFVCTGEIVCFCSGVFKIIGRYQC